MKQPTKQPITRYLYVELQQVLGYLRDYRAQVAVNLQNVDPAAVEQLPIDALNHLATLLKDCKPATDRASPAQEEEWARRGLIDRRRKLGRGDTGAYIGGGQGLFHTQRRTIELAQAYGFEPRVQPEEVEGGPLYSDELFEEALAYLNAEVAEPGYVWGIEDTRLVLGVDPYREEEDEDE